MESEYGIGVNNRYALLFGNEEEEDSLEKMVQVKARISPTTDKKKGKATQAVRENDTGSVSNKDIDNKTKQETKENQKNAGKFEKQAVEVPKNLEESKSHEKDKIPRNTGVAENTVGPKNDNKQKDASGVENNGRSRERGTQSFRSRGGNDLRGMNENSKPMACYECQEYDHRARDCPLRQEKIAARNQEKLVEKQCYDCKEFGHIAKECPSKQQNKQPVNRAISRACYECGESGHLARDCEIRLQRPKNTRKFENSQCFKCGEMGHIARECTGDDNNLGNKGRRYEDVKVDNEECGDDSSVIANIDEQSEVGTISTLPDQANLASDGETVENPQDDTSQTNMNENKEKELVTYTFEEFKARQGEKKEQSFNTRKPGEGSAVDPKWKKTTAYRKDKDAPDEQEEEAEIHPQRLNRQKKIDVQFNFTDKSSSGPDGRATRVMRGGRGERRGIKDAGERAPDILDDTSFPSLG